MAGAGPSGEAPLPAASKLCRGKCWSRRPGPRAGAEAGQAADRDCSAQGHSVQLSVQTRQGHRSPKASVKSRREGDLKSPLWGRRGRQHRARCWPRPVTPGRAVHSALMSVGPRRQMLYARRPRLVLEGGLQLGPGTRAGHLKALPGTAGWLRAGAGDAQSWRARLMQRWKPHAPGWRRPVWRRPTPTTTTTRRCGPRGNSKGVRTAVVAPPGMRGTVNPESVGLRSECAGVCWVFAAG